MMYIKNVFVALVFAMLAGCAATSYQALRQDYAVKEQFVVNRNYQAVFRDILMRARTEHQGALIGGSSNVNGQLYSELGYGEIDISISAMAGTQVFGGITVTGLPDNRSEVTVYAAVSTWSDFPERVKQWAMPN